MPDSEPQIANQIPRRKSGNPAWVKGVSGNPSGGLSKAATQAWRDRLVEQIAGEFGGIEALSFTDRLLRDKAVGAEPAKVGGGTHAGIELGGTDCRKHSAPNNQADATGITARVRHDQIRDRRMRPLVPFRQAIEDPQLLGSILHGESWGTWRAILLATMGERLTTDELAIFRQVAGDRADPPTSPIEECAFVVGRRGGKDRATSVIAAFIAGLCDHSDALWSLASGRCCCASRQISARRPFS
jgi:hypothetical protein